MVRLALLLALAVMATPAMAQPQASGGRPLKCRHVDGMVDGPHVPTAATARTIAEGVIAAKGSDSSKPYDLIIEDNGSHWLAFESLKGYPKQNPDGVITLMMGGGGLSMRIAKCDGAVSQVHYQK